MNLVRVSVPAVRKHICAGELSENRSGDKTYRVTFNLLELSLVNGKHGSETFSRWRIAEGENWNVKTGDGVWEERGDIHVKCYGQKLKRLHTPSLPCIATSSRVNLILNFLRHLVGTSR